jgi:hypothetical protein
MNYAHAFHAGNFADVFKHVVLGSVVDHLRKKDTPFLYLDTHAGAGVRPESPAAQRSGNISTASHASTPGARPAPEIESDIDVVKRSAVRAADHSLSRFRRCALRPAAAGSRGTRRVRPCRRRCVAPRRVGHSTRRGHRRRWASGTSPARAAHRATRRRADRSTVRDRA